MLLIVTNIFLSPCHTVKLSLWGSFLTNLGWPSSSSAFTLHSSLCFTCCRPKHGDSLWKKQHTDTLIMLLCRWLQCLFIKMLKGSRQSFLVKVGVNRRFTFSALSWLFLLPLSVFTRCLTAKIAASINFRQTAFSLMKCVWPWMETKLFECFLSVCSLMFWWQSDLAWDPKFTCLRCPCTMPALPEICVAVGGFQIQWISGITANIWFSSPRI